MNLKGIENIVSIYQITKIMYKGKSDLEKEIEYQNFVKNKEEIEQQIIEQSLNTIDNILAQNVKKWEEQNKNQHRLNFIDFPLNVYLWNNGTLFLYADTDEGDCDEQIVYTLHIATDSNTGSLSVQYVGSDGSFLSHKQIVKVIKMKNSMGKYA
jgi:hypothetical protein